MRKKKIVNKEKNKITDSNPQNYTHVNCIEKCLKNDNLYKNFKRDPYYRQILEHVTLPLSILYIELIKKKFSIYFNKIDYAKIQKNDTLGNPFKENYKHHLSDIKLSNYLFSPSNFRYVYTGLQILNKIKEKKINNIKVIEIGGGYGGQLFIIKILCPLFEINIDNWTIVDLEIITRHQKKYLKDMGVNNFDTISYNDLKKDDIELKEYDLFISNYGISELKIEIIELYVEKIAKKCNFFFLLWNSPHVHPFFATENFIHENENPRTGEFNKLIYN